VSKKDFKGYWRITETDLWDRDALDMIEPAHILFGDDSLLKMIAITASLDCRYSGNRVVFSLLGDDDGSLLAGRGSAEINEAGTLSGTLYFHNGDESVFSAESAEPPTARVARPAQRRRRR
jgi:hypothetical protein